MEELPPTGTARQKSRKGATIGLLAAGAVLGGIAASTLTASAAPSPSPSAGTTNSASPQPDASGSVPCEHGMGHKETPLTGSDAEKAKAAALKAVPGGTILRVETDSDGGIYEAHVVKADGTHVIVMMDKAFTVTGIKAGRGPGGPNGRPSGAGASYGDQGGTYGSGTAA